MTDVDGETLLVEDPLAKRLDRVRLDLDDPLAVAADQVGVFGDFGGVVRGGAVAEVGMGDQPELLQQLEGAVDGRDVDASRPLPYVRADGIGRGVHQIAYGFEDELALRGQPIAVCPQLLLPRRHGASLPPSGVDQTDAFEQKRSKLVQEYANMGK